MRAPELRARGWLYTGGRALTLAVPVVIEQNGSACLPLILRGMDA